jgi:imidazole glycerol-phosphate synthase
VTAADPVLTGSDAVLAAEEAIAKGSPTGLSSIEQISERYGRQAVVVSIDPRRVYLDSPAASPDPNHTVIELPGPQGTERKALA